MSKFSQIENYSWRKKFDNHDKLDNFIQESLNKFKFTKSHPELLKNISSLSHLILNSKPILPDLVIFSNPLIKIIAFIHIKIIINILVSLEENFLLIIQLKVK